LVETICLHLYGHHSPVLAFNNAPTFIDRFPEKHALSFWSLYDTSELELKTIFPFVLIPISLRLKSEFKISSFSFLNEVVGLQINLQYN